MHHDAFTPLDETGPFRERNRLWSRGDRFGRYEVEAEIGTGSVGRVYRARDPLAGRHVAIKTLRTEYLPERTSRLLRRRFQVEAQAAGGLAHAAVVRVYDQGDDYIVMEYVEGVLLSALLRERWIGLDDALTILTSVAGALDDAHAHRIVHRDVKPTNVMVLADGGAKLLDFGRAQLPGETCAGDKFLGSPSYMAPEQIVHGEATPLSDLFSLAAVAYEILTGHKPFPGENIGAITYKVVYEDPLPPNQLNPALPDAYDEIFARMLSKEPSRRLATASAFLNALEAHRLVPRAATLPPRVDPSPASPPASPPPSPEETQDLGQLRWIDADPPRAWAGARRLNLSSDPLGADVWADGVHMGTTPTGIDVAQGTHTIRVIATGFAPSQLTLSVTSDAAIPAVHVTLQPLVLPERRASSTGPAESQPALFSKLEAPPGQPS
jgi:serine/threonine protein kinase